MDTQLRELRRNATTKEDTLELLARAGRAGPETVHRETYAAVHKFPRDKEIAQEFALAHSRAVAYVQQAELRVYGNSGNHRLNIMNDRNYGIRSKLIVTENDVNHIAVDNWKQYNDSHWRSLLAQTNHELNTPGRLIDMITLPQGTFVHTQSNAGPNSHDRITNTNSGESRTFEFRNHPSYGSSPRVYALFNYENELAMRTINDQGQFIQMGWNGKPWGKRKSAEADKAYDLRFGKGPFHAYCEARQPFYKSPGQEARIFLIDHDSLLFDEGKQTLAGYRFGDEKGVSSVVPLSQHFYEKLLHQYGG